jgi:putative oxidoreductase
MKKNFFDCGTRDSTASLGILSLRVMVGLMILIGHGLPKLLNFTAKKDTFYVPDIALLNMMSPQVSFTMCIFAEVFAASLIIIGFATRSAAFILGFAMVVAAFGAQASAPWFINPPTVINAKELALMYLIPMIAIILSGAGRYSLDQLIYKDAKRRRW